MAAVENELQAPAALAPEADEAVEYARELRSHGLARLDRLATLILGGAFAVTAAALALLAPTERSLSPFLAVALVIVLGAVSRIEFESGLASFVPLQLVFVPVLFLAPLRAVPILVACAMMLSTLISHIQGRVHIARVPLRLVDSWFCIGPVLVLLAFGEHDPSWRDWPVYLLALAAQYAFDFASVATHLRFAHRASLRPLLRPFLNTWAVDGALAPLGLLAAFASVDMPYAVLLVLPLVALLDTFSKERRTRLDHALELSHAYRGTAFLLGDVVEADDEYTGRHSKEVVDLVLGVADRLGLAGRDRQDAEFTALLHDVGKVRMPKEIINKPGPLTTEERRVIETHTLEGERMLEQVGGLLGRVGRLVRSCHERFDGAGYPDRLAGEQIPLVSRIVMCCDAYSAMTSDRPYRKALSEPRAVHELQMHAGTQFDPRVVEALVATISG